MIINKWDEAIFALGLRKIIDINDNVIHNPQDLEYARNAFQYFHYCMKADRPDGEAGTSTTNDACEGVDKLYSLGKAAFAQYWILSGNGQKKDEDAPEATKYRDEAEQYLIQALNCPWSQEKQRQKKDYIAERLARLYITKGTQQDYQPYQEAVDIIEQYQNARLDAYIIHTLALALMLLGKHTDAKTKLKEAVDNRFNLDIWTSYFLMGCSLLRESLLDEASQAFQKSRQRKETDTLLFGEALIAYKSGRRTEALEMVMRANQMNPYRISLGKYLEIWSEGRIRPLIP